MLKLAFTAYESWCQWPPLKKGTIIWRNFSAVKCTLYMHFQTFFKHYRKGKNNTFIIVQWRSSTNSNFQFNWPDLSNIILQHMFFELWHSIENRNLYGGVVQIFKCQVYLKLHLAFDNIFQRNPDYAFDFLKGGHWH